MPTKAMVASAYAAHLARRAGDYGVSVVGQISIDMKRVHDRSAIHPAQYRSLLRAICFRVTRLMSLMTFSEEGFRHFH